jgi:hypothetical protein
MNGGLTGNVFFNSRLLWYHKHNDNALIFIPTIRAEPAPQHESPADPAQYARNPAFIPIDFLVFPSNTMHAR